MIFTNIILFVLQIIQFLIGFLPDVSPGQADLIIDMQTAFAQMREYVNSMNWLFPIDFYFTLLAAYLGVLFVVIGFKTLLWVAANISGGIVKK